MPGLRHCGQLPQTRPQIHDRALRQKQLMDAVQEQASQITQMAGTTLLSAIVAMLLIGCVLACVPTRSLALPLIQAAAAQQARGQLDSTPLHAGVDEVGDVMRAIQSTRQSLLLLVEGMRETDRQHHLVNLSFRVDAMQLDGEYRNICQLLDAQIGEAHHAALLAGRLASRYTIGDMSEDFPPAFPATRPN